jgi:adsorption protein B
MLLAFLALAHHELMLFAAVGLALGSLDDFLIDIAYFCRRAWRNTVIYARHPRMTTADLPASRHPGTLAIFIPAWREADVIAPMLRHALRRWGEGDYRLFVGVYPNDPDTLREVALVAEGEPRIVVGITDRPGPTTKADCLNRLWQVMLQEEERTGTRFKAVVLHDAEDVVHADEIRLFDLLIDRFAMVQLPVLPILSRGTLWSRTIAGHYADEFAEAHGKYLAVREAVGASIPSAGVGCAFARDALAALIVTDAPGPFDDSSLTEDYETGLRIADQGKRGIFVRIRDAQGQLVCTREHFPDSLDAAVRQKARWIVGIALSGWDRMGWQGGPMELWMRFRDRRSALAALILAAYLTLLLWAVLGLVSLVRPIPWTPLTPALTVLLAINLALMLWRLAMRGLFVGRAYGWRQGLAAIPRTMIGNLVAILAARRAIFLYVRSLLGNPLVWDKTQHRFPDMEADA